MTYRGQELYMCKTDFEYELGETSIKLYPDIESLKTDRKCVNECGIVAVRVELVREVEPGIPYTEWCEKSKNNEDT